HRADTVVLADLAQEVDRTHRRGPVEVVHHACGVLALEAEVALDLRTQAPHPFLDGLTSVECALGRGPGVADESGRSADQAERLVTGELDAAKRQQLHEVAEVQARSCRVES